MKEYFVIYCYKINPITNISFHKDKLSAIRHYLVLLNEKSISYVKLAESFTPEDTTEDFLKGVKWLCESINK